MEKRVTVNFPPFYEGRATKGRRRGDERGGTVGLVWLPIGEGGITFIDWIRGVGLRLTGEFIQRILLWSAG